MIVIILNCSNGPILCSLKVCLCFVWRMGGCAPCPPSGYATGCRHSFSDREI